MWRCGDVRQAMSDVAMSDERQAMSDVAMSDRRCGDER